MDGPRILPNIQGSIHKDGALKEHMGTGVLILQPSCTTDGESRIMGDRTGSYYGADSKSRLRAGSAFSEAGKTAPGQEKQRFLQSKTQKKTTRNYFFCKLVFLTLRKKALLEPFIVVT